ncbi:UNVERIFIED_CONTAM: hypothetical protein Slati_3893100 [Sesamum latifolium]|uniref:Uncharacterized protein n=1 Tax=Sesamum latifolium TaxID=2727402 RepID=A0AAW2TMH6_9LAMI
MENRHAVHCSLRAVNLAHGTEVTASWAFSRVKRLQERHEVFNWLIKLKGAQGTVPEKRGATKA